VVRGWIIFLGLVILLFILGFIVVYVFTSMCSFTTIRAKVESPLPVPVAEPVVVQVNAVVPVAAAVTEPNSISVPVANAVVVPANPSPALTVPLQPAA